MKRLVLIAVFLLAACSEVATPEKETETAVETADKPKEEAVTTNTQTTESGTFTQIKASQGTEPVTSGPFTITIPQVSTVSAELTDEAGAYFGTNNINYVHVDMDIAHTTEATDNLWLSFIKIVTNTGEQLEFEAAMSDIIDSDFYGEVTQSGSYAFILNKSNPEDIEWIRVLIDPPHNANNEEIGEPFDMRVDFQ